MAHMDLCVGSPFGRAGRAGGMREPLVPAPRPPARAHQAPAASMPTVAPLRSDRFAGAGEADDEASYRPPSGRSRPRTWGRFAPTADVRNPEHLHRLLATIEGMREESGENVQKLRAWLAAQQREMSAWLRKQAPVHARRHAALARLGACHAVTQLLHAGEGDAAHVLHELLRLDEGAVIGLLPQMCDVLVLRCGALPDRERLVLRAFLIHLCTTSQHIALHVCWYLRALVPPQSAARSLPRSPRAHKRSASASNLGHRRTGSAGTIGLHRRASSRPAVAQPTAAETRAAHAHALARQLEEAIASARDVAEPTQDAGGPSRSPGAPPPTPPPPPSPTPTATPMATPPRAAESSAGVDRLAHLRLSLLLAARLAGVCESLLRTPRDERADALRAALGPFAEAPPRGAWLPVGGALRHHAVHSFLPDEAVAISTNKCAEPRPMPRARGVQRDADGARAPRAGTALSCSTSPSSTQRPSPTRPPPRPSAVRRRAATGPAPTWRRRLAGSRRR